MSRARIEVNGVAGSNTDVPWGTPVILTNDGDGSETTWRWAILAQPTGTDDNLNSTSVANPTFTPTKEGSYLINLIVNYGLVTEKTSNAIVAVQLMKSRTRRPATGETTEANANGWGVDTFDALFGAADLALADPTRMAAVAELTVYTGDVVRFGGLTTLKSGVGEETLMTCRRALAAAEANVSGLLAYVIGAATGGTIVAPGEIAIVRLCGLTSRVTGVASLQQTVYVSNAGGPPSTTIGTYARACGEVIWTNGTQWQAIFDGHMGAGNPRQVVTFGVGSTSLSSGYLWVGGGSRVDQYPSGRHERSRMPFAQTIVNFEMFAVEPTHDADIEFEITIDQALSGITCTLPAYTGNATTTTRLVVPAGSEIGIVARPALGITTYAGGITANIDILPAKITR